MATYSRWWTYQQERFPVAANAPLIAAFSFSAISYSAMLRGYDVLPHPRAVIVSFLSAFLFFLQLRFADEFKDFEEDSRYRPYRPVPRGLIKLRELGWAWFGSALLQLMLAIWLNPALAVLLLAVWAYLALMSKEFFAKSWLKGRPFTYMWTHMLIMPLIDFYTTACDWLVAGVHPPKGLVWFLLVSFFNGMVVEIGRKIRAQQDEETGVETYSFLWGRSRAVAGWLLAMMITAIFACLAAQRIDFRTPVLWMLAVLIVSAATVGTAFLRKPKAKRGHWFEIMSGVWSLLMYLSLGAVPLFVRAFWGR